MILINLLPHREEKRKRRKIAFFAGLGVAAIAGLGIVGVWYAVVQCVFGLSPSPIEVFQSAHFFSTVGSLDSSIRSLSIRSTELLFRFYRVWLERSLVLICGSP